MKFTLESQYVTKNHVVIVSAWSDGKNPPVALARLAGFGERYGDSSPASIGFTRKALKDGSDAIEGAQKMVDEIQEIADKFYKTIGGKEK